MIEQINPETKTEIILANWFYIHGIPIWHNRKIKELNNTNLFTTKGDNKKLDLIIYSRMNNQYIGIEIKTSMASKNIYDSNKIIEYQQRYDNQQTKYFIDDKQIKISVFLSATENSPSGHLFQNENIEFPHDEKWHEVLQKTKQEPPKEYHKTKQFLRMLWSEWRKTRTVNDSGIGILLSSVLDDDANNEPKMFIQIFENNRWNVRWREI